MLRAGQVEHDRLVVVVDLLIDGAGNVTDVSAYRARVVNRAKLTYEAVGMWLAGGAPAPEEFAGFIKSEIGKVGPGPKNSGRMPFDPYTLYYVGQALYQVGGEDWKGFYPRLRDSLVSTQIRDPKSTARHGHWNDESRVRGHRAR